MRTIHEHHNDTTATKRRSRRRPAVAAFALAAALPLPPAAGASDPADCYPVAADVGSIVAPSTALPTEAIEAMLAPVQCSASGAVDIDWPAAADVGSIL